MTMVNSRIDAGSEAYRTFAAHNKGLANELRERVARAALGGPEKHRERHVGRGKLLPRDRVDALIRGGAGGPFDAGKGTPMKEWLMVMDEAEELALAREALTFVGGGGQTSSRRPY